MLLQYETFVHDTIRIAYRTMLTTMKNTILFLIFWGHS